MKKPENDYSAKTFNPQNEYKESWYLPKTSDH